MNSDQIPALLAEQVTPFLHPPGPAEDTADRAPQTCPSQSPRTPTEALNSQPEGRLLELLHTELLLATPKQDLRTALGLLLHELGRRMGVKAPPAVLAKHAETFTFPTHEKHIWGWKVDAGEAVVAQGFGATAEAASAQTPPEVQIFTPGGIDLLAHPLKLKDAP